MGSAVLNDIHQSYYTGTERTAPSKTKDRMSSVSLLMGVESNSGTADARATVTWPSAEFAARLRPLPNCSFMCHSFHSRIFELLHWINTRTACAVCDDLTITYLRVTHDSASTATASDHRFKAKIVYIIIKILRYSCGAVSDLKSNISTGLHSAIRHLTLRLFFTTESVVCWRSSTRLMPTSNRPIAQHYQLITQIRWSDLATKYTHSLRHWTSDSLVISTGREANRPTQLSTHGQWWSNLATQRLQIEQCLERIGLWMMQVWQNWEKSSEWRSDRSRITCIH